MHFRPMKLAHELVPFLYFVHNNALYCRFFQFICSYTYVTKYQFYINAAYFQSITYNIVHTFRKYLQLPKTHKMFSINVISQTFLPFYIKGTKEAIIWKSWCHTHILVTFRAHLKKLHSEITTEILTRKKLNCGFFHSFHWRKNSTKQLPIPDSVKISAQKITIYHTIATNKPY